MWESQHTEISTAIIRYRLIYSGGDQVKRLAPEEMTAILSSADLVHRPDDLKTVCSQIIAIPLQFDPPWGLGTLSYQSRRTRDERHYPWGDNTVNVTGDKGESVYYQSVNKQADIFPESRGMGATSLRELRFIPWQVAADKLQLLKSEANTATLQMGDATIAVDLETGFVNSWISESPEGLARMEHLQFGPVHYPEGIVFPTVVFHNAYSHGVLARVQAFIIEDARFNVDLAESTFSVNSPAQTVVVDHRRSDEKPTVTRIPSPAADLVEALEEQVKSQQVRHARGLRGEWSLVIVAIFAVASAAAGAALWLRHTKQKS